MAKEAVRMKPERMMEFLRPRKLRKTEEETEPRMASSGGSDTIQDTVSASSGAPATGWLTPVPLTLPFKLEKNYLSILPTVKVFFGGSMYGKPHSNG